MRMGHNAFLWLNYHDSRAYYFGALRAPSQLNSTKAANFSGALYEQLLYRKMEYGIRGAISGGLRQEEGRLGIHNHMHFFSQWLPSIWRNCGNWMARIWLWIFDVYCTFVIQYRMSLAIIYWFLLEMLVSYPFRHFLSLICRGETRQRAESSHLSSQLRFLAYRKNAPFKQSGVLFKQQVGLLNEAMR